MDNRRIVTGLQGKEAWQSSRGLIINVRQTTRTPAAGPLNKAFDNRLIVTGLQGKEAKELSRGSIANKWIHGHQRQGALNRTQQQAHRHGVTTRQGAHQGAMAQSMDSNKASIKDGLTRPHNRLIATEPQQGKALFKQGVGHPQRGTKRLPTAKRYQLVPQ